MSDLADLTILEAAAGLRAGEFTALDLLEAVLRRAAITESHLHAYLTIDRDGAIAAARAADEALAGGDDRPLLGIPVALKDNMVTRGIETTASSQILAGWKPPYDGTAAARLRSGGAVYDALVAAAAVHHGLPLVSRDQRALDTYRTLGLDVEFLG